MKAFNQAACSSAAGNGNEHLVVDFNGSRPRIHHQTGQGSKGKV